MNQRNNPIDLSIIIPLYNCEIYLEECLSSVVSQFNKTYEISWEVIIVNDGSTDSSRKIAIDWSQKYENIILFDKQNEGVAKTRNFALDKSKGKYIYFIDPDDKLNYPILPLVISLMEVQSLDILKFSFNLNQREGDQKSNHILDPSEISKFDLLEKMVEIGNCMLWQYIFRKETIGSIRFDENIFFLEDFVFLLNVINRSNNNLLISNSPYFYRYHDSSITNSKQERNLNRKHQSYIKIINETIRFKKENIALSENLINKLSRRINLLVEQYCFISIFLKKDYKEIKDNLLFLKKYHYYPFKHDPIVGNKFYHILFAFIINRQSLFKILLRIVKIFKYSKS